MKMDIVNLPVEEAVEPSEVAQQPLIQECETDQCQTTQIKKKQITFADAMDDNETPSQTNSEYKDVLSQPAPELNQRERLVWLQRRRKRGLWAQCDECKSWRFLPDVLDAHELPKKWYCHLNPDPANGNCSVPEAPIPLRDEEDLIHSEYSAGSVVWARMQGYPWWPGIVDDCPDTEQFYWLDGFSDIPTHYNVSFFDSTEVTRAWVAPEHLKPYSAFKKKFKSFSKDRKYKTRLQAAIDQANDAVNLPLSERLKKYSFLTRYKGDFKTPKKISKKILENNQSTLKRKFRIEFEMSDSENEFEETPRQKSRVR